MRCTIRGVSLLAAILVAGCLAAGCGSTVQSAIGSVTSGRTAASPATLPATTAGPRTTAPPTTAPPATTAAPTATTAPSTPSAAPSTAVTTVTTTATPAATTATPTATPTPTAAVSGSGSGTNLIWLWVLLGVLVLVGLITWIARSGRRRSAAAAGWRSKLIDAYAKGSALYDAMSVAEMQGDLASSDADARWYDIQRRADDFAQTLYALREAAPDPGDQARIADVLASLQAVRSAMDAERAPGGAGPQQADVVNRRLSAFESSLRALRAGDQEFS